jgi:hypothetical protein
MMEIFWVVCAFVVSCIVGYIIHKIPNGPSICPNCHKQYEKAEPWSYAEYAWGLRCPHCKHDFDITP